MTKSYGIREKRQTDSINSKYVRAENGRLMLKSVCTSCGAEKSKFIRNQEGGFLAEALVTLGKNTISSAASNVQSIAANIVKSDLAKK